MSDLTDRIRQAVQAVIDQEDGDAGWTVTQYVVAMGLERIHDARIESCGWVWSPPDQADWMTVGLLEAALEMRAESFEDE
jgi:hypothetical protein